jgi:hypothetical protein
MNSQRSDDMNMIMITTETIREISGSENCASRSPNKHIHYAMKTYEVVEV